MPLPEDKVSLSESVIQRKLYWDCVSASLIVLPNFTPTRWWECDFFRVTRAGYFYEYEIKLSKRDFLADKEKSSYNFKAKAYEKKHQLLENKVVDGPSRFFYVVPSSLVPEVIEEIPVWAGLISASPQLFTIKQAPQLHRKKISSAIIRQVKTSAYNRYWGLLMCGIREAGHAP